MEEGEPFGYGHFLKLIVFYKGNINIMKIPIIWPSVAIWMHTQVKNADAHSQKKELHKKSSATVTSFL
jgi:hypothetical protein